MDESIPVFTISERVRSGSVPVVMHTMHVRYANKFVSRIS